MRMGLIHRLHGETSKMKRVSGEIRVSLFELGDEICEKKLHVGIQSTQSTKYAMKWNYFVSTLSSVTSAWRTNECVWIPVLGSINILFFIYLFVKNNNPFLVTHAACISSVEHHSGIERKILFNFRWFCARTTVPNARFLSCLQISSTHDLFICWCSRRQLLDHCQFSQSMIVTGDLQSNVTCNFTILSVWCVCQNNLIADLDLLDAKVVSTAFCSYQFGIPTISKSLDFKWFERYGCVEKLVKVQFANEMEEHHLSHRQIAWRTAVTVCAQLRHTDFISGIR